MRLSRLLGFLVAGAFPAAAVLAADIPLVPYAEGRLEAAAGETLPADSVRVDVGGFPVVGRVVVTGEVATVDYAWRGVRVGDLRAESLRLELDGVAVDRTALVQGELRVTGVEEGRLRIEVGMVELGRVVGREVRVDRGEVVMAVTPATEVAARISASPGGLVLSAGPIEPVVVELDARAVACAPSVSVRGRSLVLECSFRGVPALLRP